MDDGSALHRDGSMVCRRRLKDVRKMFHLLGTVERDSSDDGNVDIKHDSDASNAVYSDKSGTHST